MTNARETDQRLVEQIQAGQTAAFNFLVKKYQTRVMALISRFVNDQHEVEDLAQETFIKAYRALKNFRGDSAFYTWLYRIAVNTAKNHLITSGRRPPNTDIDLDDPENTPWFSGVEDGASPEANLMRDELEAKIFSSLEQLPDDLKTAISLRELEGLSYEEIADIMQCPVGTVRSRIFRAREALDKAMQPLLGAKYF